MARSKSYQFTAAQQQKAAYAKALGHAARIQIIEMLRGRPVIYFEEFVEVLPLAKGTIGEHFRKLERVNFVIPVSGGEGRTGYRLNRLAISQAQRLLLQTLQVLNAEKTVVELEGAG